jgi:hypothetical protein
MKDNRSQHQWKKMYRTGKEPAGICFECRQPILEDEYYIAELHLLCPICWEIRVGRIERHSQRVWDYINNFGDIFNGDGNPVDVSGEKLSWLIQMYKNDYILEEFHDN